MPEIETLRRQVDAIDGELLRLLSRRAQLAVEIGILKRKSGLSVHSSARERALLLRARRENTGPLDEPAITRLFRLIIQESKRAAEISSEPVPVSEASE
ncbi:MAG: chorismate mutase [Candidatus Acidiferrales bacterium]